MHLLHRLFLAETAERRSRLAIIVAVIALAPSSGRGEPGKSLTPTQERRAAELYEEGLRQYNVANYDAAIAAFKESYLISEAPELLYNIGQAYRLQIPPRCAEALRFYKSYLRIEPTTPRRALVERTMKSLEPCVEPVAPTPPPAPAKPVAPPPARADDDDSHWPQLVVIGSGGVAAIAGGVLVTWSNVEYARVRDTGCAPSCDPALWESAQTRHRIGLGLLAIGGAAAAVGIVWWLIPRHASHDRPVAWIAPSSSGFLAGTEF